MNDTPLLTPKDVAERLQVTEAALAAWRRGVGPGSDLPFIRVGGSVRYRETDLTAWLEARTEVGNGTENKADA